MPARLTDVVRGAGVSLSTAARALNNADHPMADGTRRSVLEAAEQLGYRPNLVARSLRTEQTLTVGIVVENLLSPFTAPIIRGIQDYLDHYGCLSIIINSDWDPETELRVITALTSCQIAGFVNPSITTIQMPCEEMGRKSAEVLLNVMNGAGKPDATFIPGRLIVRQPCGASSDPWDFEPERASLTREKRTCIRVHRDDINVPEDRS